MPKYNKLPTPIVTPEQDRADARLARAGFWAVILGLMAVSFILEIVRG